MTSESFTLISKTDPVVIEFFALNAKPVDGIVKTIVAPKPITRTPTQIDESTMQWRFRPTLDVRNVLVGFVLEASLPGNSVIARTIKQNGTVLQATTDNPKQIQANPVGAGNIAMTIETLKFVAG